MTQTPVRSRVSRAAAILPVLAVGYVTMAGAAFASPEPDFECKVLAHPLLQRDGYLLGSNIYMLGEDRVGLVGYADPPEQLPQVISGSGIRYSNGVITFAAKGDEGFLELNDGTIFPCKAVNMAADGAPTGGGNAPAAGTDGSFQPSLGRSLFGSIVRASPDPGGRRLASIPQGDPVEFIGATGTFYDGWQWVRVRYGNGREGFVWGGTVCVTGGPAITGVHATCN